MDDNRSGENPPSAAESPPQPKSGKPLGFNRSMQQIGQIFLPVFRILESFLGVHSIFLRQH